VKPGVEKRLRHPHPRTRTVSIAGIGSYAPERVLTNKELEQMVQTTDDWIVSRTGMKERRIAAPGETTSQMAARAGERALADAGIPAADLDLVVVATSTPDMPFPSTGCLVQNLLGATRAFGLDVSAACSGFLYALHMAHQFLASGAADTALVIGAEKMSSITDWTDRTTCVLFGDAAGAVVLQAGAAPHGLIHTVLGSDGSLGDLLMVPGGGSKNPVSHQTIEQRLHYLKMNGREVYKHAVTRMSEAAGQVLQKCGLTIDDVDCIIPHQANVRIIQHIAQRVHAPIEKFFLNVEKYGNTSAASVGVALDEAYRTGRVKKGDILLLVVFGGGFTWGATVLQWDK
jgi:3-oxoacyl-[acyl-carrier-protein] synthase-3